MRFCSGCGLIQVGRSLPMIFNRASACSFTRAVVQVGKELETLASRERADE